MCSRRSGNTTVCSSRSTQKQPQVTRNRQYPAELVTYRLGDDMVYVEPPRDYEQALDFAKRVFPSLADTSRSRLAFQVSVRIGSSEPLSKVRIAPMAWARAMKSLATYEIIEILILPEPTTQRASRSETDFVASTASSCRNDCDDDPPKYSASTMLGCVLDRDSEKSTQCLSRPAAPSVKRSISPFNWITRHL